MNQAANFFVSQSCRIVGF